MFRKYYVVQHGGGPLDILQNVEEARERTENKPGYSFYETRLLGALLARRKIASVRRVSEYARANVCE